MFRVSGPHYVSVYQTSGCIISLFGDIHFSKYGSCDPCEKKDDCMNIIELYDNLEKPVDILLESLYLNETEKKTNAKNLVEKLAMKDDWLSETNLHFHKKLYHKHKSYQKVRVHYCDIRSHTSFEIYHWIQETMQSKSLEDTNKDNLIATYVLLQALQTKYHFKKIADAIVKSNNIEHDMKKVFGDKWWIYVNKEDDLTTFPGIPTKIHRIRKQVLKLSPRLQKAVIKYHNEASNDILIDYHCYHYVKSRKLFLKELKEKKQFVKGESRLVIDTCISKWLDHLMNIYLISRMLYCIEKGTSKNITLYTGANHTYVVDYFLKNYMNENLQHKWKYDSERENPKELRCVYMPKEIIQSMTNKK